MAIAGLLVYLTGHNPNQNPKSSNSDEMNIYASINMIDSGDGSGLLKSLEFVSTEGGAIDIRDASPLEVKLTEMPISQGKGDIGGYNIYVLYQSHPRSGFTTHIAHPSIVACQSLLHRKIEQLYDQGLIDSVFFEGIDAWAEVGLNSTEDEQDKLKKQKNSGTLFQRDSDLIDFMSQPGKSFSRETIQLEYANNTSLNISGWEVPEGDLGYEDRLQGLELKTQLNDLLEQGHNNPSSPRFSEYQNVLHSFSITASLQHTVRSVAAYNYSLLQYFQEVENQTNFPLVYVIVIGDGHRYDFEQFAERLEHHPEIHPFVCSTM